ncbi:MAG TPA: apolipoprotein N-acyltransferase [Acidimicrobiales bacterium]|nr:apolipoprotein N-acyltransferase [Acidimicrobiales bacterium]
MRRFVPLAAALATGVVIAAALPPWGWWPLAFVGIVALDRLIADQPRGVRFRRGSVIGIGLYVPSLAWMLDMTIPGYAIATAAYAALLGLALMAVPARAPGRWLALPGAVALAELLRWSWPFGGVPLSSLAVGQAAGPLAPVLRVGGTLLLVEVTLIAGVALAALVARRPAVAAVAGALALVAVVGAGLAPDGRQVGTMRVALVQGGGPQGTRASATDERLVFDRHLEATDAVRPPVDLVVWPEDVVDVDGPIEESTEGRELVQLARRLGVPLIAGVVEGVDSERFRNASVAYDGDGEIVDRYDKVHRVPFGEYVPLRSLIEPFGGADLSGRDAVVGDHPALLDTAAGRVSVAISWEVFFGDRVREGVESGAEVVLNPTNGSSFTGTLVQTQQVASSRMRAIESGRWVLQTAPTGFSAVIGPDGTVRQRTAVSEQAVLQATVGRRQGTTLYTRWGLLPGWIVAVAGLALGWGLAGRRSRRDAGPARAGDPASGSAPMDDDEPAAADADAVGAVRVPEGPGPRDVDAAAQPVRSGAAPPGGALPDAEAGTGAERPPAPDLPRQLVRDVTGLRPRPRG